MISIQVTNTLTATFSYHCTQTRPEEVIPRMAYMSLKAYEYVLRNAYLNGLLSFQGQQVVVTAVTSKFIQISLLIEVTSYTNVKIITVKNHWKPYKKHIRCDFLQVRNRINLLNQNIKLFGFGKAMKMADLIDRRMQNEF